MKAQRGFTLIELMISAALMVVAVAAAGVLLIAASSMARNAQNYSDDSDNARMAGEALAKVIQSAGLLTPGGIWVNAGPAAPTLINPVFGIDGTSGAGTGGAHAAAATADGSDDLWVVVPDANALREACKDSGAGVMVTASKASGPLAVHCNSAITTFDTNDTLLATNSSTGAILSPPLSFPMVGGWATIKFKEDATSNYSDSVKGSPTGFTAGDMVFRVQLMHYFIKADSSGRPGLFSHRGVVGDDSGTGRMLTDDPDTTDALVQDNVEDLQVSYRFDPAGNGNPLTYTAQDFLKPEYDAANPLRSVRVNIVAVSKLSDLDTQGSRNQSLKPPALVENHDRSTAAADGYRRSLYTRRLELPNTAPGNL
jgi:prepilin-type N-terminal cleavage/methylation domain-containing protein